MVTNNIKDFRAAISPLADAIETVLRDHPEGELEREVVDRPAFQHVRSWPSLCDGHQFVPST